MKALWKARLTHGCPRERAMMGASSSLGSDPMSGAACSFPSRSCAAKVFCKTCAGRPPRPPGPRSGPGALGGVTREPSEGAGRGRKAAGAALLAAQELGQPGAMEAAVLAAATEEPEGADVRGWAGLRTASTLHLALRLAATACARARACTGAAADTADADVAKDVGARVKRRSAAEAAARAARTGS